MRANRLLIEILNALKRPASPRPILINHAPIIPSKKLAPSLPIRQHLFHNNRLPMSNPRIDAKRRELSHFPVPAQDRRILMPILLAARRRA